MLVSSDLLFISFMASEFPLIPGQVLTTHSVIFFSTASIIWGFTHRSLFHLKFLKFIVMYGMQWGDNFFF